MKDFPLQFIQIPAFTDNYIWMIVSKDSAWVVDPGDSAVVIDILKDKKLRLEGLLITHHHKDHVGGIADLSEWALTNQDSSLRIIGPINEEIPLRTEVALEGDQFTLFAGVNVSVFEVPGHTKGHIAYFLPQTINNDVPRVFCGDTLFAGGCGRLFEGSPAQMSNSLHKLMLLPGETLICCAHEYTLSNLKFAKAVDPHNADLINWITKAQGLRDAGIPTVPTNLALEMKVNPFLRCSEEALREAAESFSGGALVEEVDVFAAIRAWKDVFK